MSTIRILIPSNTARSKTVIKSDIPKVSVYLYGIPYKRDVHQFDHCIKPYTLAPEGGPTLPQSMLLFNRSYIRVKDILIICHPVPQLATFSYPRMKCTGLVDGNRLTWFVCFDGIYYKTRWSQSGRTKPVYNFRRPAEQISHGHHGVTAFSVPPHISVLCFPVLMKSFCRFFHYLLSSYQDHHRTNGCCSYCY
ncbi:unnamed protein product [Fasciola hepatica]|uniref:Uncharacterized protein n=1 Tax=Fasciola hepatica TaxID=6192 RepID=A0ABC9HI53_FASHE